MNAEELFRKLGYFKYESKQLNCIEYRKNFLSVSFMLETRTYETSILCGDLNFPRYRTMEITTELHRAINKQIEELRWFDEQNI